MAHMTPSERLIERLRVIAELRIPDTARVQRTYAGQRQREAGAWSWYLTTTGRELNIGSYHTVTELLRSELLVPVKQASGDWTIYPGQVTD